MSTLSKALLILALIAASSLARSDGIYPGGLGFMDGVNNPAGQAVVTPGCSGTGLVFTSACNSQYVGIL